MPYAKASKRFSRVVVFSFFGFAAAVCATAASDPNLVIIASKPVTLTNKPMVLVAPKPMLVIGKLSWVCFAVRDGVRYEPGRERALGEQLSGIVIRVTAIMENGERIKFTEAQPSWSSSGVIMHDNELSVCASGINLSVGATVAKIEASASSNLQVQGAYWRSVEPVNRHPIVRK